jgi:hypothetical protein
MKALLLDAGALIAVERDDRSVPRRINAAREAGMSVRTTGAILAEVWRDPRRQVKLARLLQGVEISAVDAAIGRAAGILLGRARLRDVPDASLVAVAASGDEIATSDVDDITHLAQVSGYEVIIVSC